MSLDAFSLDTTLKKAEADCGICGGVEEGVSNTPFLLLFFSGLGTQPGNSYR